VGPYEEPLSHLVRHIVRRQEKKKRRGRPFVRLRASYQKREGKEGRSASSPKTPFSYSEPTRVTT